MSSFRTAVGPSRRTLVAGLGATAAAPALLGAAPIGVRARIAAIEANLGGRLGLAAHDVTTGRRLDHRADEPFPMCSTFKMILAAAALRRVDEGRERLDRRIAFGAVDLLPYAPVTRARLADGAMSLGDLCAAAVTLSDNTAANLLLAALGGPGAVTAFARSLGDGVTRLDRTEPDLNTALKGDPRDTTTPRAMINDLGRLVLGDALTSGSRALLTTWLVDCQTGGARLRAGLPRRAKVGDKTGSGANGTSNDVAVVWPSRGGPWLIAVYVTGARREGDSVNAAIAEIGSLAAGVLAA